MIETATVIRLHFIFIFLCAQQIKEMMARVEEEQKSKLESVAALQDEQRTALGHLSVEAKNGVVATNNTSASSAAVSEQIDALFAQLSTSNDVGNKQSTNATAISAPVSKQRIDTAQAGVATNTIQPMRQPSSSMMSLRPTSNKTAATTPGSNAWANNNLNGGSSINKDPVSSMMMSNLTNLSSTAGAVRPNLQWGATSAPMKLQQPPSQISFTPNWNTSPAPAFQQHQPVRMASPMVPQNLFNQQPPSSFSQPSGGSNAAVRPLARSDIDDLLG